MNIQGLKTLDRPLLILLIGVLLSHLGNYMVVPIIPIVLSVDANLTVAQIGVVLATIALSFQIGSVLGGFLADRIGRRFIIGLGALIGAGGLLGFGIFTTYPLFLLAATVTGVGNGLNAPSTKAAIAALASQGNQTTAFSLRGIAAGIGTATAGLIVFFVITGSSQIIFWIAGGIYIVLAIKSWFLLPKNCEDGPCPLIPKGAYFKVFKNKPFLVFGVVSIFIWALYAQLALALPLRATEILPNPENVALIWSINSGIVIFSQGIVTKWIIQRLHPLTALAFGMVLIGAGVGSLYWTSSFLHLVISGTIFVFGEMLILPTIDSTISQLSTANLIGLFFGLANVIYGLGEAAGKLIGGKLLEAASEISYLPWLIFGITGVILAIVILTLRKWEPLQKSLEIATEKSNTPKKAPKVAIRPTKQDSFPLDRWEPEFFLRKRGNTNKK
ncbi:MFS transporter [Bacillus carboniphilus]|uniref:MFS transporter n=1 Tax=Bacillus carboniphilus TaxID=86663 RepID=A0ABP3G014_9BACI